MNIGKGIAIAGIWIGFGIGLAFGHLQDGTAGYISGAACAATIATAVFF